jgi:hypothetical protein
MHIHNFPYEIISQILEEVTKGHIRDGPTYTYGLSQAPLPLQKVRLHRYVRGPTPPHFLNWDGSSMLRSVCRKWHDWALAYALKDVYIRYWDGAEVSKMQRSIHGTIITICRGGPSSQAAGQPIQYMNLWTIRLVPPCTATHWPVSNRPSGYATTTPKSHGISSASGSMDFTQRQQTALCSTCSRIVQISDHCRSHGPWSGTWDQKNGVLS